MDNNKKWTGITTSTDMFKDASGLPNYESTAVNASKAYVGSDGKGYYSKNMVCVKEPNADNETYTLHFYCDNIDHSGTGKEVNTFGRDHPWNKNNDDNERIDIDKTITKVIFDSSFANARVINCDYWFCGFTALTEVQGIQYLIFKDKVNASSGNIISAKCMFRGCSSLKSLDCRGWNRSNSTTTKTLKNASYMFADCTSLVSLNIMHFDYSGLTDTSYMFYNCRSLENIYCENTTAWSPSLSTDMFSGCINLPDYVSTEVGASKAYYGDGGYFKIFSTVKLIITNTTTRTAKFVCDGNSHETETSFEAADNGEPSWTDVADLSSIKSCEFDESMKNLPSYVTTMDHWLANMTDLVGVTGVSNLNTANVTNMSYMFYNCSSIRYMDLRLTDDDKYGLNISSAVTMSCMFKGCSKLSILYINGYKFNSGCKTNSMFENDSELAYIFSNNTDAWNASSSSLMFDGCISLPNYGSTQVDASKAYRGNNGYFTETSNYTLWSVNNTNTTTIKRLSGNPTFSTSETPHAFAKRPRDIKSNVVIDASVKNAGLTSVSQWFDGSVASTISGLANLGKNITDVSYMFNGCTWLDSINLNDLSYSKLSNLSYMFNNCASLTRVDITSWNFETTINSTEYMFNGCTKLEIIAASNVGPENNWKVTNSENMFYNCTGLKNYDSTSVDATKAYAGDGSIGNGYFRTPWMKALYKSTNKSLTFHYDSILHENEYEVPTSQATTQPWDKIASSVATVAFDESFKNARPTTCYNWFSGFSSLSAITSIVNLNISNAQNLSYMFSGCSNLTSINLASLTPSTVSDASYMFYKCSKLMTIILPSSGWSASNISHMFDGCTGASSIQNIDKFIANAENLSYLFNGCSSLLSTVIPSSISFTKIPLNFEGMFSGCKASAFDSLTLKWTVSGSISSTKNMFYGCTNLVTLDMSEFKASSYIYDISGMFNGCSSLKNLSLPSSSNFNTSGTEDMSYMFSGCESLTSPDTANFNTSKVTSFEGMFKGCKGLTTFSIANFVIKNGSKLDRMFEDCINLEFLDIRMASLRMGSATTAKYMFQTCSKLSNIRANPNTDWRDITPANSTDMFSGCLSAKKVVVDSTYAYVGVDGYFTLEPPKAVYDSNILTFYCDNSSYSGSIYNIPTDDTEPGWITDKKVISTVKFDESFASYKPTYLYKWFYELTNLTSIDLTNLNSNSVIDMSYMFAKSGIETIIGLSNLLSGSSRNLSHMFDNCTGLKGIDISGWYTHINNVTDMSYMFYECKGLETINVTGFAIADANISNMFNGCAKLVAITGTNTVAWNYGKPESHSSNMFSGCTKLPNYDETKVGASKACLNTAGGYFKAPYVPTRQMKAFYNNGTLTFCYDLDDHEGTLYYVTGEANPPEWLSQAENITNVVFNLSFADASPTICYSWFSGCSALTTIEGINYLNTSDCTDMSYMFNGCSSLSSITTSFDTSSVLNMSHMFSGCSEISYFDIRTFDTSSVTDMSYMFNGCSSLSSITTSFDTSSVLNMSHMFSGCSAFTSINILSSFNTSSVTDMSYMFYGCSGVTSFDLSSFSSASLLTMKGMFKECSALQNVTFSSSFTAEKVTSMESMFRSCSSLESVNLSNFSTKLTDASWMFSECKSLSSVSLPKNTTAITTTGFMFNGCSSLTSLNLSEFKVRNATTVNSMFKNCTALTTVILSDFYSDNTTNMDSMFEGCSNLISANIAEFVPTYLTSCKNMFKGCSNLVNVYVNSTSAWNETTNLVVSTNMFSGCINISCYNPYNPVTDATKAYAGGDLKGYFTIADPTPKVVYDGLSTLTFYCDNERHSDYTVYRMPGDNKDPAWSEKKGKVYTIKFDDSFRYARPTSCYNWFNGFSAVTSIEGIENLDTRNVTSMKQMFYGCSKIETLDLRSFDIRSVTNMTNMFAGMSKVNEINLVGWNVGNTVSEADGMFKSCTSLKKIFSVCDVNSKWSPTSSIDMFKGCGVVPAGSEEYGATKAYYGNGGYFSVGKILKAVYSSTDNTLTFYYDDIQHIGRTYYATNMINEAPSWNSIASSVTKVVFDYSVNDATPYSCYKWFNGFANLTSIANLNFLITNHSKTMAHMFYGCSGLKLIQSQDMSTDRVTDMSYMFKGCSSIESINLSNFNTSNVLSMTGMFSNCSSLSSIDVSAFDVTNLRRAKEMFNNCSKAVTISLAKQDRSNNWSKNAITDMYGMFNGCTILNKISGIESLYTYKSRTTYSMFNGCKQLTVMDLSDWNTWSIHLDSEYGDGMEAMFKNCTSLHSVNVFGWSIRDKNTLRELFSGCSSLRHIYSRNTSKWEPEGSADMFKDCTNLHNYSKGKAEDNTYAYVGTDGYFEPKMTAVLNNNNLTFYNDLGTHNGTSYDIPINDVDPGWINNSSIISAAFDQSFANAQPITCYKWFSGCSNISLISNIKYLNTKFTENMSCMFDSCASLTSLDVSRFNTANVIDMSYMFNGCSSLNNIYANLDTDWSKDHLISDSMFAGCTALVAWKPSNPTDVSMAHTGTVSGVTGYFSMLPCGKAVYDSSTKVLTFCYDNADYKSDTVSMYPLNSGTEIPLWLVHASDITLVTFNSSFESVLPTTCRRWFYGFSNLIDITNIQYLDTSNVTDMSYMFEGCSKLRTLHVNNFSVRKVTNMQKMFSGCHELLYIYSSGGLAWDPAISTNMFAECYDLPNWDVNKTDKTCAHAGIGGYFIVYETERPIMRAVAIGTVSKTLMLTYDTNNHIADGTVYNIRDKAIDPSWLSENITGVSFSSSFIDARPKSTYAWFKELTNLESVTDIKYLNTSECENMKYMFYGCNKLQSLDVSRFVIKSSAVIDYMFTLCEALETIYSLNVNQWTPASSTNMFYVCTSLPNYDSEIVDATKAYCADDGYFTLIPPSMKAVYISASNKLIFYYDNSYDHDSEGTVYYVPNNEGYSTPPDWLTHKLTIYTVEFDSSFGSARPLSCYQWFNGFTNLTTIVNIQYLNTSAITSVSGGFESMFDECVSLTEIDVSGFTVGNNMSLLNMFNNCSLLETIYAATTNTPWPSSPTVMFAGCTKLLSDATKNTAQYAKLKPNGYFTNKLPTEMRAVYNSSNKKLSFYYDNVDHSSQGTVFSVPTSSEESHDWGYLASSIQYVEFTESFKSAKPQYCIGWFNGCYALKSITNISNLDTSQCLSMGAMFAGCSTLTEINVTDFNTSNVTSMENMFYGCSKITTLDLRNWNVALVTNMNGMFYNCFKLKFIISTNTSKWTPKSSTDMFSGCTELPNYVSTEVDASKAYYGEGGYFSGIAPLSAKAVYKDYYEEETETYVYELTFYYDSTDHSSEGTIYNLPTEDNVSPSWLEKSDEITRVKFDESFVNFKPVSFYKWFYMCQNIDTVNGLEYIDATGASNMSYMFYFCEKLNAPYDSEAGEYILDFSSINTEYIENMKCMFSGAFSYCAINLSGWNVSNVKNMEEMFCGGSLSKIYVKDESVNWATDAENLSTSTNMFYSCYNLTNYSEGNSNDVTFAHVDNGGYFTLKALLKDRLLL